jgi:hypothetical protein
MKSTGDGRLRPKSSVSSSSLYDGENPSAGTFAILLPLSFSIINPNDSS